MAKVKDKAAMAARKRERKAGNLDYTSIVSVKPTPTPKVNPIVATLKTKEENAQDTQRDVTIGLDYFHSLTYNEKYFKLNLQELKYNLRDAVIKGDFGVICQIDYTLTKNYKAMSSKESTDAKQLRDKFHVKALHEAVDFLVRQFTAGKMRWWIAKSHLNNHFDMQIPLTLPRANARVGVN